MKMVFHGILAASLENPFMNRVIPVYAKDHFAGATDYANLNWKSSLINTKSGSWSLMLSTFCGLEEGFINGFCDPRELNRDF